MRIYLAGIILIATLSAGCSADRDTVGTAGKTATDAATPVLAMPVTALAARPGASGFAALPDRGELLRYSPDRKARRSGAYTSHPVDVSEAHALNAIASGELRLNMPDGTPLNVAFERIEEQQDGNWTWVGRNEEGQRALLTFGERAVFGEIFDGSRSFRLRTQGGTAWMVETDSAQVASRPESHLHDFLVPGESTGAAAGSGLMTMSSAPSNVVAKAGPFVDVVIGFTNGMVTTYGSESAVGTQIAYLTALTNDAYTRSGVTIKIRVVKTLLVNYADNNSNNDTLRQLTGYDERTGQDTTPNAAFTALRAAREEFGGDLVALIRPHRHPEQEGCGVAWLIRGGQNGIIDAPDAKFGYAVVSEGEYETPSATYFCSDYSLAHELGHNMGQVHNQGDAPTPGMHDYSYGYRETSTTGFHTIMAYPIADSSQTEVGYFATPLVNFAVGRPLGVANLSDNVRSMNQTMAPISQFRETKVPIAGNRPNIYVVKRVGSSGRTEVHVLGAAGDYKSYLLHASTILANTGTAQDWVFRSGDYNNDGTHDVYAIKKNGSSGKTEVHVMSGAGGFKSYLLNTATTLHATGSDASWDFQLGDYNRDGKLDLYAIKRNGSSGKTEIHVLNGADNFKSYLLQVATVLASTGSNLSWRFALADHNGDTYPDLYAIKRIGSSGRTEVHVLNGANRYQNYLAQKATALAATGSANDWEFVTGDYDEDGIPDLYTIKKAGSSGRVEVHVLRGAGLYQSYILHAATPLAATGTNGGWQFVTP